MPLLLGLLVTAAVLGDAVNYSIGHRVGPAVFRCERSWLFNVKHLRRAQEFYEKYGSKTIILARFVPIVRTFAPVAAGVGHMPWRRYTLYNFIGAMLWGFGLVMLGYLIGFIPWVADLVTEYIDIILLVAVGGTALVTLWHYLSERRKAKKAAAAGEDVVVDDEEAKHLVLDPEVFERGPEHADRPARTDEGTAPPRL
jgi:membrane-associated protein